MNLRTVSCWAVCHLKRKEIVIAFRTKKDLKLHYPLGIPIWCVLVQMKGHYVRRVASRKVSE